MGIIAKAYNYKWIQWAWLTTLVLVPIVLWILPADSLDNSGLISCPSRYFFYIECLGCGMTRAVMHMHHLEFKDALFFNYGVVVVYPALILYWFIFIFSALRKLNILPAKK